MEAFRGKNKGVTKNLKNWYKLVYDKVFNKFRNRPLSHISIGICVIKQNLTVLPVHPYRINIQTILATIFILAASSKSVWLSTLDNVIAYKYNKNAQQ